MNGRLLAVLLLIVVLPVPAGGQEWLLTTTPRGDLDHRAPRLPKPPEDLFSINGAFLGTLQWVARSDTAQHPVFGASWLDLTVTVRPSNSVRIFMDLEGLVGPGPDSKLGSLSGLNNNTDDLEGKDKALRLTKLILRKSWLEDRVRLSVGKLDPEDYFDRNAFAEDDASQFLNGALVTNPMLQAPPNGPGAVLRVTWGDWRSVFGVHGQDDVDGDLSGLPFVVGEVSRRNIFALVGHYRLWARVNAVPEDRSRVTWGIGVNVDQLLTSSLGVFFRAGVSRSQGQSLTSYAWSVGVQFTPPWLGGKDALGIGYGEQREPGGRERVVESYYRLTLADWMSLIASIQWIPSGPNTVTGGVNRNLVVPGLRASLQF